MSVLGMPSMESLRRACSDERVRQFFRYGVVAVAGLLLNLGITYGGVEVAHMWYFLAFVIGTFTTWTASFFALAFFVFPEQGRGDWVIRYLRFLAGYGLIFLVNGCTVYMLTSVLGVYYLLSITVTALAMGFAGFMFSRRFVYAAGSLGAMGRHWPALVLGVMLGAITVAPQLIFMHAPAYQGIQMMGADAEEHYVARMQEVDAGYAALGNVFLSHKDAPYLVPGLGENIVARLGSAVGVGAAEANVAAKFFFPFLIALLAYALCYALFASRPIALLGTVTALVGDSLVSGPTPWLALLHGISTSTNFLTLSRPINPEISWLFLFGGMLLFVTAFIKRAPRAWEVVALGLITGLALYVSPYPFTFLGGLLAMSLLWYGYRRDRTRAYGALLSGVLALVCAIPFMFNYHALSASAGYAALALRQGLVHSHAPLISVWLIIMLLAALFVWPRRYPHARTLYLFAVIVLIALTDQQLLTGVSVVPSHYHWYLTKPLIGIMAAMYAWAVLEWVTTRVWLRWLCGVAAVAFLFYNAALIQATSYHAQYPSAVARQAYAPALTYLSTLPLGESVWADSALSQQISIYTEQNAPNNFYSLYYLVSDQYLVERMLLNYELAGIPAKDILATLAKDRADVSAQIFGIHYREQYGSYAAIPDSLLVEYAERYRMQLARPLADVLRDVSVTLVAWDTAADPAWHIDRVPNATEVFSDGRIRVYQISGR